ncbi:MAG: hypothetical protein MI919_05045 [Holophagales bacterium]|nr:hypothetical protein [Holophagales bacterium]
MRILARENLKAAWKRVKANQGAPGIDGMSSIEEFPAFSREHWPRIRKALLDGSYRPSPLRQVMIPRPSGRGERQLRIPTVLDRVIRQASQQTLTPILDPSFSASSFGCLFTAHQGPLVPTDQLPFLRFLFRGTKICWSEKTSALLEWSVRRLTNRNWGVSMPTRLAKLEDFLRGWMGYFWISEYYRPIPEIDQWIRRRIRMRFWVQWRQRWTRIGNLLKLGVASSKPFRPGAALTDHGICLVRMPCSSRCRTSGWLSRA